MRIENYASEIFCHKPPLIFYVALQTELTRLCGLPLNQCGINSFRDVNSDGKVRFSSTSLRKYPIKNL